MAKCATTDFLTWQGETAFIQALQTVDCTKKIGLPGAKIAAGGRYCPHFLAKNAAGQEQIFPYKP